MTWRKYHEFTKHSAESLRRNPHYLDWANMPDPFRHYEGVPVLDLPADPPSLELPALQTLHGIRGVTSTTTGPEFLSQLLFYSAAISASKRVPQTGSRYALRVNPSSGNLHPTEFHFLTRGLEGWPDGLYHYRPSDHMAEQRALGGVDLAPFPEPASIVFILTSIAWREAWKYRDRAYRYCLHDIGHAWQALALAARAMGCDSSARGCFPDDEVAERWRLADDEWPMLVVELRGPSIPVRSPDTTETVWYGGQPNRLSDTRVVYPRIDEIHQATKLSSEAFRATIPRDLTGGEFIMPAVDSGRSFGDVARTRRSALDFLGGEQSISMVQFAAILNAANRSLWADFAEQYVTLYLYVHRVAGFAPGVYRFSTHGVDLIKTGDQRVAAAGLSLGQDLAGNACMAFSMIGDLERATSVHGDRGYRYVHFEAGAIGHRLYLAAVALGLGATGIGAFFDEQVHKYLGLAAGEGQAVYHFAIGFPVPDPRLEG